MSTKTKGVPVDISTEILTRLPVKSVYRFRAACKSWCSSIDHPLFVEMHLNRNPHPTPPPSHTPTSSSSSIMLIPDPYVGSEVTSSSHMSISNLLNRNTESRHADASPRYADFYLTQVQGEQGHQTVVKSSSMIHIRFPDDPSFCFVGSCNGLLCFSSHASFCWGPISFISNPATNQYFRLPDSTHKSFDAAGFGVCPATNQLKLVKLYNCSQWGEVHTIGGKSNPSISSGASNASNSSKSWRMVQRGLIGVSYFDERGTGIFANGSVHWLTVSEEDSLQILSFDLEDEKFRVVPNPEFTGPSSYHPDSTRPEDYFHLSVFRGCLSISDCCSRKNRYDIWVMKEKNTHHSWTKQFVIMKDTIGRFVKKKELMGELHFCTGVSVRPISFLKNGDLLLLCGSRFLVSYNLETKTATLLEDHADFRFCHAFPYVLNFISPESVCKC